MLPGCIRSPHCTSLITQEMMNSSPHSFVVSSRSIQGEWRIYPEHILETLGTDFTLIHQAHIRSHIWHHPA